MRIALFYPRSTHASWYTLGGYEETLTRMGHDVVCCELPGNLPGGFTTNTETHAQLIAQAKSRLPKLAELKRCDCILLTFAEYVIPWLQVIYSRGDWKRVPVPKIARFDESFDRVDLQLEHWWPTMKEWADHFSFPSLRDAEAHQGSFLAFGADETKFCPKLVDKKYGVGFVGALYDKRLNYGNLLVARLHQRGIDFSSGPVYISDLSGTPAFGYEAAQTHLLADNYRQLKVFFCLPPMSQLLVCKVFEVMACGTFMMYPKLTGVKDLALFEDGKHLVYYDEYDYDGNVDKIAYYLSHDAERERIAEAGCNEVMAKYKLSMLLEKLLAPVSRSKVDGVSTGKMAEVEADLAKLWPMRAQ